MAKKMANKCYIPTLSSLATLGCLRRDTAMRDNRTVPLLPQLPVYVLSVPGLKQRVQRMKERLAAARVADVTWNFCANRDTVTGFDDRTRRCLHPEYVPHPWARKGNPYRPGEFAMANGTLSLALKHQLVAWDILRRGIRAALVLEDDALVPADLWRRLADLERPLDADVFYIGSYSRSANIGTLAKEPLAFPIHRGSGPTVHRRLNGSHPLLVGTNAYILFARAASAILNPVRAEADIALSFLDAPRQCRQHRGTDGIAMKYQSDVGRAFSARSSYFASLCDRLHPPPGNQYGLGTWIVGQDLAGLEQKTHWDVRISDKRKAASADPRSSPATIRSGIRSE